MALKAIGIELDEDLLARIEMLRGKVARQRFIGRVLEQALSDSPQRASIPVDRIIFDRDVKRVVEQPYRGPRRNIKPAR